MDLLGLQNLQAIAKLLNSLVALHRAAAWRAQLVSPEPNAAPDHSGHNHDCYPSRGCSPSPASKAASRLEGQLQGHGAVTSPEHQRRPFAAATGPCWNKLPPADMPQHREDNAAHAVQTPEAHRSSSSMVDLYSASMLHSLSQSLMHEHRSVSSGHYSNMRSAPVCG